MTYEVKEIYFAPSSQPSNKYAFGNTNEQAVCQDITAYIVSELENYHCGIRFGNKDTTLQQDPVMANASGATSYYAIHTNAGGGKGVSAIYQTDKKLTQAQRDKSKLMATELCNAIAGLGRFNRGAYGKLEADGDEWYSDLRVPLMASTILEIEFHDWVLGAKWIIANKALIGKTIARTVAKIENLFRVYPATVTARPSLNIRAGAGTTFAKIGTVAYGEVVSVYAEKTNGTTVWCRIHPTEDEWVSKLYLLK